ncbi:unnamed protein product [Arctogadus glacialis]
MSVIVFVPTCICACLCLKKDTGDIVAWPAVVVGVAVMVKTFGGQQLLSTQCRSCGAGSSYIWLLGLCWRPCWHRRSAETGSLPAAMLAPEERRDWVSAGGHVGTGGAPRLGLCRRPCWHRRSAKTGSLPAAMLAPEERRDWVSAGGHVGTGGAPRPEVRSN